MLSSHQAAFSPLFLSHGSGQGSGTYQLMQISSHDSLSGPPSPSPSFSSTHASHQIPSITNVRSLGFPLDTTFTSRAHCKETVNTARRSLFIICRSFLDFFKTAFTPLCQAIELPCLEYAKFIYSGGFSTSKRYSS